MILTLVNYSTAYQQTPWSEFQNSIYVDDSTAAVSNPVITKTKSCKREPICRNDSNLQSTPSLMFSASAYKKSFYKKKNTLWTT